MTTLISMKYQHTPVLLQEVLQILSPKPNHNYVDATLGGGGYTNSLLSESKPSGKVMAIDLDEYALDNAKKTLGKYQDRLVLAHGNFRDIDHHVKKHKFKDIDGIVADIGLSSYQLDQSGRGISFQKKELLDMRFDISSQLPDARFILNHHSADELTKLFSEYGEEKFSKQIARKIIEHRGNHDELKYTTELNEIIQEALPKPKKHLWQDAARKIYQALRIEVNQELANLEAFLPKAFDIVNPGGRLVVVTFHSLEDRITKKTFKELMEIQEIPVKILTKRPMTASDEELSENSRSRSAKLRLLQRV